MLLLLRRQLKLRWERFALEQPAEASKSQREVLVRACAMLATWAQNPTTPDGDERGAADEIVETLGGYCIGWSDSTGNTEEAPAWYAFITAVGVLQLFVTQISEPDTVDEEELCENIIDAFLITGVVTPPEPDSAGPEVLDEFEHVISTLTAG